MGEGTWLATRALAFVLCTAALLIIGLLVQQDSPIYWWMSTPPEPLPLRGQPYSPADELEPLLGRLSEVKPLAAARPGRCNVLLSQHAHTLRSDGSMTAQQALDWHEAHGYTAVAVTDHNTWSGGLEAVAAAKKRDGGLVALAGMEWTHCRGHYNFLLPADAAASFTLRGGAWVSSGVPSTSSEATGGAALTAEPSRRIRGQPFLRTDDAPEELTIPLVKYPSDDEMRQAFSAVHVLGGVVVANHLAWSSWSLERDRLPSRAQLEEWNVDYIELAHEMYFDAKSLKHVKEHKIGAIAGGDVHFPTQHAYGWTCLNVSSPRDEASIFEALRRPSDVDILFDAEGSPDLLQGSLATGDAVDSWPSLGVAFAPLRWVGEFVTHFYKVSAVGGGRTYEYSFVDGFCGPPQTYSARWPFVLSAVGWAALFFLAYHACWLFASSAKGGATAVAA